MIGFPWEVFDATAGLLSRNSLETYGPASDGVRRPAPSVVFGVPLTLADVCGIVLHAGLLGAWIGMCLDNTTRAVLVAWLFRRGRWMLKSV